MKHTKDFDKTLTSISKNHAATPKDTCSYAVMKAITSSCDEKTSIVPTSDIYQKDYFPIVGFYQISRDAVFKTSSNIEADNNPLSAEIPIYLDIILQ